MKIFMGLGGCHATPCDLLPDDTRIALLWGRSFSVHSAERRTTERLEGLRLLVRRRHSSIHLTGIFSPRLGLDAATYSRPWRDKCILQCKAISTTNHGMALDPTVQIAGSRQRASSSQRTSQLHTSWCFGRAHSSRLSTFVFALH